MKAIHYAALLIKKFNNWFNSNFTWFFTNGRKIWQPESNKK